MNEYGTKPVTGGNGNSFSQIRYEAMCWMYSHLCCLLDKGIDPRQYDCVDVLKDALADLGQENTDD